MLLYRFLTLPLFLISSLNATPIVAQLFYPGVLDTRPNTPAPNPVITTASTKSPPVLVSPAVAVPEAAPALVIDMTDQLLSDLLPPKSNYNKLIMPPRRCALSATTRQLDCEPFLVQTRLFLIRIQEIKDNSETFYATVRLQLGWNDTRLAWRPELYGGLRSVILPGGVPWIPDLQLANSFDSMYVLANTNFNFRLNYDGELWWHPTATISTKCRLQLDDYPFDYQRCAIAIESVIYNTDELLIRIRDGRTPQQAVSLSMFSKNEQWKLITSTGLSTVYRTSNSTAFSRMHFWLLMKRQPDFVEIMFLLPIGLLSAVQLMTYVLPTHFIDRTPQATVVLLATAVYQGSLTQALPQTAEQSRVFTYLNMVLGMSTVTVGICALTISLVEPDEGFPAPFGIPLILRRLRKAPTMNNGREVAQPKRLTKGMIAAFVINWLGFSVFFFLVVIYPCVTFIELAYVDPPLLPKPKLEIAGSSYYPETD